MKAAGIVCEYNPFHNGHCYHIKKTREITRCDVLVCVMSGNFVQRGEPAIFDKRSRTKAALSHDVDLVLELPFPFVMQSAAGFAEGAISSLALANVKDIVFGSESNDITALIKLAHLNAIDYRDRMKDGLSPAKACEIVYGKQHPNDILGMNYIKAMEPYGIIPHTIKRANDYHKTKLSGGLASASALRNALFKNEDICAYTPMHTDDQEMHTLDEYYPYIQGLLLSTSPAYLHTLFMMDEGMEHQLRKNANQCDNMTDFLTASTCRRYTTSRIRRTLIHLLHQTTKQEMNTLPPLNHIRILGFNATGQAYLKELKQKSTVQIASRINQIPLTYRKMELKTAHIYGLMHNRKETLKQEMQPPVRL